MLPLLILFLVAFALAGIHLLRLRRGTLQIAVDSIVKSVTKAHVKVMLCPYDGAPFEEKLALACLGIGLKNGLMVLTVPRYVISRLKKDHELMLGACSQNVYVLSCALAYPDGLRGPVAVANDVTRLSSGQKAIDTYNVKFYQHLRAACSRGSALPIPAAAEITAAALCSQLADEVSFIAN